MATKNQVPTSTGLPPQPSTAEQNLQQSGRESESEGGKEESSNENESDVSFQDSETAGNAPPHGDFTQAQGDDVEE